MRIALRAAVVVLLLALAACAGLPRPAPPEVVGARVSVAEARLPDVRLVVDLALRNPNRHDLAIEALEATLAVGGADVGRASLARPVTLPASGEARVPLDVRGDASRLLASVGAALGGARPLDYEVRGTLTLAGGVVVPFRRAGQLPEARRP